MTIENLQCPECGGPMISRANTKTGQRFWGCRKYPDCRGTRNTDGEAPSERSDRAPSERQRENDRDRWRRPS
jgi:ssDNA-binding Zn-finger/Zn-ribbon topoisomerase 1